MTRSPRGWTLLLAALLISSCSTATPQPSGEPLVDQPAARAEARLIAQRFIAAWRTANFERMYQLLAPEDRARYSEATFVDLYRQFTDLVRVTRIQASIGPAVPTALPAEPRPPDLPPPSPTPNASASPTGSAQPLPSAPAGGGPGPVLFGPVPGLAVDVGLAIESDVFGPLVLDRRVALSSGARGWHVRWTPAALIPELGDEGTLKLSRSLAPRGRIVAADGTVFAANRKDGVRIYPQDWLAGQTIGYVSAVTAEDLKSLAARGYRAGDVVGRSGLEAGAEDLLRGTPAWSLSAVPAGGKPTVVLVRAGTPGADLSITLRADVQRAADAGVAPYAEAATAAIDPKSGDVWALASAPAFNPNAMTSGTTMAGVPLPHADPSQVVNNAVLNAYPAGSSFKPFTLAAALKVGLAGPATRRPCPGTWTLFGFMFQNYEMHQLPGLVSLPEAMAFSCNTTYMPLSMDVYQANPTALTDMVAAFGFGQPTGIKHLPEDPGVLPDAAYYQRTARWDGNLRPYGPFDQVQLAIGQGDFRGTQLQLARAYAAFGNGGIMWVPRLVISARLPSGKVIEANPPTIARRIALNRDQLSFIVTALEAVVNLPYGTGYGTFQGFGIQVAGKSGTAETGGPDPDALFPAIAPAQSPTIAVSTILARIHLGTGGTDAAPLVRRVMAAHFAR